MSTLKKYRENPLLFINEILDDKPRWAKQIEIIESVRDNRNTYVKSCHGVGKTFTAKDIVMWFLYCFYPATVLTTAPSWPQVEKLLWAEINTAHANAKIQPLGGECKKTELYLDSNWFALGISPRIDNDDEAKRLTGFHNENLLVIFDEAPACHPMLWKIKETLMTSANVKFLAIGNPVDNHGDFHTGFMRSDINSIDMNIFHSPNYKDNNINNVDDLYNIVSMDLMAREDYYNGLKVPFSKLTSVRWAVERLEEWGHGSPLFQSRVLGEFPEKTSDTIISFTALERCRKVEPNKKHIKTLGVDVARYGVDDTVFMGYDNFMPVLKEKYNGHSIVETSNRIKWMVGKEKYKKIVIDDTGLGGGVTDIIEDWLDEQNINDVEVIPVNFAQASQSDEYDGIVTEMYYNAKEMIDNLEIKTENSGNLFQELASRKYKFTTRGKIKVESKDDYKKRTGLKSPDEGDAFILCLWGIANRGGFKFVNIGANGIV